MSKQLYDKNHNSFYPLTDALSVTDTRLNKNQQTINQDFESKISSLSGSTSGITETQVNSLISTALNKVSIVNSINNQTGALSLKSINNQSLLGNGNITITSSGGTNITLDDTITTTSTNAVTSKGIATYLSNNYTKVGHTHTVANITDFKGGVEDIINEIIENKGIKCNCSLASATKDGLLSYQDYQALQLLIKEYNKSNFAITSFTVTPTSVNKGATVTLVFNWTINTQGNTITSLELTGGTTFSKSLATTDTSYTLETSLQDNTTYTLVASSGDISSSAKLSVSVISTANKVYVGGIDKSYSSSNMTASAIQSVNSFECDKGGTVQTTVVTTKTQKILVAYPTSYGTPTFTESIFSADFSDWETGTITINKVNYTYHITDTIVQTNGSDYKLVFNN